MEVLQSTPQIDRPDFIFIDMHGKLSNRDVFHALRSVRFGSTALMLLITGVLWRLFSPIQQPSRENPHHNHVYDGSYPEHCNTQRWSEVAHVHDAAFSAAVRDACGDLLALRPGLLKEPKPLIRLHVLKNLVQHKRSTFVSYFEKLAATAVVDIVIGTYDRPLALRNTLESIELMVSGANVSVSYDAQDEEKRRAYEQVLSEFDHVKLWNRSEHGGYFNTLLQISAQPLTHVLVAADDTTFVRPVNLRHVAAMMMLLGDGEPQDYRVTCQLRMSYRHAIDTHFESVILEKLAFAGDAALYVFLADCSDDRIRTSYLCYDRHIDGPMYSIHQIRKEWPRLPGPSHPGELEGQWMGLQRPNRADFALFLADQIAINTGMDMGTVRNDRKSLDGEEYQQEQAQLRDEEAQAILKGCRQSPMDFVQELLRANSTHVGSLTMEWKCPA